MTLSEKYQLIIGAAFQLFAEGEAAQYAQKEIAKKLKIIDHPLSEGTISNLKRCFYYQNLDRSFAPNTLKVAAEGLQKIIESELGQIFDNAQKRFVSSQDSDWQPVIIQPIVPSGLTEPEAGLLSYAEGRRSVSDKVHLYKTAEQEIIEMGVRLKSFATHFITEGDHSFRLPLLDRLNHGVQLKCYILNPRSRFTADYFHDRGKVQVEELETLEELPDILEHLKNVQAELNAASRRGKMSLYLLNSYPYLHASIADGNSPVGRMFVSHYLYGIRRANCPVFEIQKNKQERLFNKYWRSIKSMMNQATPV